MRRTCCKSFSCRSCAEKVDETDAADLIRPRAKLSDFGSSDFTSDAWKREKSEFLGIASILV